jgi:hypothetical protein
MRAAIWREHDELEKQIIEGAAPDPRGVNFSLKAPETKTPMAPIAQAIYDALQSSDPV